MLPHLHNGWQVDQAILSEEDRVVVIRFGHDWDPTCMKMDEVLYSIAEKVTRRHRFTLGPLVSLVFHFFCFATWQENVKAVKTAFILHTLISNAPQPQSPSRGKTQAWYTDRFLACAERVCSLEWNTIACIFFWEEFP